MVHSKRQCEDFNETQMLVGIQENLLGSTLQSHPQQLWVMRRGESFNQSKRRRLSK